MMPMKKYLVALLFLPLAGGAQTRLSNNAEISVITFGPGQRELYSAFGHSAFRVNDPVAGFDDIYNYGVFNFDQPNFYLNFTRGHLNYMLGVGDYKRSEYVYIYYNRYVHEQKLNLTQEQKQRLFDFLQWNALPENQYYLYDYFYNNCATKLPDIVSQVFKDSVKFDGSYIKTDYTIRELTDIYLKYQPWGDLGIDICLGLPMDKKATPYQYMFLPDYVESGFAHATILHGSDTVPLVKERVAIFESRDEAHPHTLITPLLVFSAFFVLIAFISYRDIKRNKLSRGVDITVYAVLGLLGLLLLVLWVATDHRAAAKNFNLLWALPTHIVAAVALIRNAKWLEKYFLVIAALSVLLLITWPWLPQKLHYALIPLVMASGLRAFTQYYIRHHSSIQPTEEKKGI
jgi:hypothetical protein